MKQLEIVLARRIMQLKADPFCTNCGATCIVVQDSLDKPIDINGVESYIIITACSICASETEWTATQNHISMLQRTVALAVQRKGDVIYPNEFVRNPDGTCRGLCGGVCPAHWDSDAKNPTLGVDPTAQVK